MKIISTSLFILSLVALTGCATLPLMFESDSYGMAIGTDNKEEPWSGELVINSYHLNGFGLPDTSTNINSRKLIENNNSENSVEFFVEDKLYQCLPSQNNAAYIENLELANNYLVLDGKLDYKATITFLKKRKYSLELTINDNPPYLLNVYYPVDNCDELRQSMLKALMLLNHEVAHLYFIKKQIINNYTLAQNEYWAYRISLCSFLLNEKVSYVKVYNLNLSDEDNLLLKSKSLSDHGLATRLGMKKAYNELYTLAGNEIVKKDNPNISGINQWCENIP